MSDRQDDHGYGHGGHGSHGAPYDPANDIPHVPETHVPETYVPETYVPEPLSGQVPLESEPGAAFGAPAGGDAWAAPAPETPGGQGAYGTSPRDGWAAAPAGAQSWQPPAPGAWEHPGAQDPYAGGAAAGPHPYPQPYPEPLPQPQPYAYGGPAPAAGGEHTAVLPVVEEPAAPAHAGHGEAAPPAAARRTGSPIIAPGLEPAALTAGLGLLTAGAAALGRPALAVALVLLQAVTAAGWFRLNGMWPARQGIALAFLSGVTADVALLAVNGRHGPLALAGTLGVWLLLVLVLQLRHHGSADERLSSLTATSASTLLTVVAATYLATATSHAGRHPVEVGAIAVAAATLVRAVRLPGGEPVSLALALLTALASGLATGPATGFGTGHAALLAAAAGACALVGLRVASYDWPSRFVHFTAGVALPLTAAAPVVYALGRALG